MTARTVPVDGGIEPERPAISPDHMVNDFQTRDSLNLMAMGVSQWLSSGNLRV